MKLKAIIFDLDGVITDTAHFHYLAWREIGRQFGYEMTPDDNERIKGLSRLNSLKVVLNSAGASVSNDEFQALALQKNEHYQQLLTQLSEKDTLIGVDEFLADCRAHQLSIAVGSASKNTKRILTQIGLIDFFDAIVDGNMVTHSKPDPEVFLQAAELLKVSPENTVVFEDAIAGIDAANAGGFYSIGVGKKESLGHAQHVIPNMDNFTVNDLLQLITKE